MLDCYVGQEEGSVVGVDPQGVGADPNVPLYL